MGVGVGVVFHLVVLISPKKRGRFPKHLKMKSKASLQPLETCHFYQPEAVFIYLRALFFIALNRSRWKAPVYNEQAYFTSASIRLGLKK